MKVVSIMSGLVVSENLFPTYREKGLNCDMGEMRVFIKMNDKE